MRLKYVPACPPSLNSLEISSRNIRIRIPGSETLSLVCVALTTTGQSLFHPSPPSRLTRHYPYSFPGSQPVSFSTKDLERLENEECVSCDPPHILHSCVCFSYWVCEKSDGVRVLLVVLTNLDTSEQMVCIVRSSHPIPLSASHSALGRPSQYLQGNHRPLLSPS